MISKSKSFKFKEYSIFIWLFLISFFVILALSIYLKSQEEQDKKMRSLLENTYLKKTFRELTVNLKPRFSKVTIIAKAGDNHNDIIGKLKIDKKEKQIILDSILDEKSLKILKINQKFTFKLDNLSKNKILEFIVENNKKNQIVFTKSSDSNKFTSKLIKNNFTKKIIYKETIITDSLYNSAIRLGIKPNIIIEFARLYGFQVDFQRDIWKNDSFK